MGVGGGGGGGLWMGKWVPISHVDFFLKGPVTCHCRYQKDTVPC